MNLLIIRVVLLSWCVTIFSGCATTDQKMPFVDKPVIKATGAGGDLYLSVDNYQWDGLWKIKYLQSRQGRVAVKVKNKKKPSNPDRITIIKVMNDKGKAVGERVMPVYAGDILRETMKQELDLMGYTVKVVDKLPNYAIKGVDISQIFVELEQGSGLFTFDGTCRLKMQVDIWRNGTIVASHDYESKLTDYSFSDRNQHISDLLIRSAQNIAKQAAPDIEKTFQY